MNLEAFQKRLGTTLAKSTHPDDFAAIRKETNLKGADVVDHAPDLKAHPRSMGTRVEEYRKAIQHQSPLMDILPHKLKGVTAKALYKVHSAANLPNGKLALVKPYHEALHPNGGFWQNHPIHGWAEMTNQSLYHAAGMGDMHQDVHVSEHDMGPGMEKSPAIVVHMDPSAGYVHELDPFDFHPKMVTDATKIGIMDFLSNNLDRHRHNLMVRPADSRDHGGMPYSSQLLAIDHGRSFQYHSAHKGAPSWRKDDFFGTIPLPKEAQDMVNADGKVRDFLEGYLDTDALSFVTHTSKTRGNAPVNHPASYLRIIEQWWPGVRDRVITAFNDRLEGIKEPRMKEHLYKNFKARTEKLDDIAARPEHYLKRPEFTESEVPLHTWDR